MYLNKLLAAAAVTVALATGANAASILTNGGFETGNFFGWTANVATNSNGSLNITDGGSSPNSSNPIPVATEGTYYSVTDQNGPGAYSLIQSFVASSSMTLSFDFFAQSGSAFADNGTLDFNGTDNQYARVDILTGTAGAFDVGSSIVQTLIAPTVGLTPQSFASFSFALNGLTAGNSYQLRFAQVDNRGFFQMGVDNVSLEVSAVLVPAAGFLLLGGLGLLGVARRRKTLAS